MPSLVLGLDVGGTSSRAMVTTLDGEVVGIGSAGGGNPLAVPLAQAAEQVEIALRAALAAVDPADVRAAAMGIAGAGGFDEAETAATFQRVWDDAGLRCPVRPFGDPVVAFAGGTDRQRGTVLIAGTGSVAVQVDGEDMPRIRGGLGWLLGDRGSGFWIGRSAATTTAVALQRGDRPTALTSRVAEAITDSAETDPHAFSIAVYRRPPQTLARLAPLVTDAALAGDRTAAAILDEAAAHLTELVTEVRDAADTDPIVLSGSIVSRCRPVRDGVREYLATCWPHAPILDAGPAELGAARLAARWVREPKADI